MTLRCGATRDFTTETRRGLTAATKRGFAPHPSTPEPEPEPEPEPDPARGLVAAVRPRRASVLR